VWRKFALRISLCPLQDNVSGFLDRKLILLAAVLSRIAAESPCDNAAKAASLVVRLPGNALPDQKTSNEKHLTKNPRRANAGGFCQFAWAVERR
jgi:hypothetical protein